MSEPSKRATLHVALYGNPNTGKSTLFSLLAGVPQRVGNYPGVTVEKKVATAEYGDHQFTFVDLPGTYSLAPRSPDEMVSVDVLLGRSADMVAPDIIVCVVDASFIERNLYLVSQVLELERPVVVVLNKTDIAQDHGIRLDIGTLSDRLGVPVVEMQAHRQIGLEPLRRVLLATCQSEPLEFDSCFPVEFRDEVTRLGGMASLWSGEAPPRYLVERILLDTGGYLQRSDFVGDWRAMATAVKDARRRLDRVGYRVPTVETTSRYQWVDRMLEGVVSRSRDMQASWTDKMDSVLTHRVFGSILFLAIMVFVFQSIFGMAGPVQDAIGTLVASLGSAVTRVMPSGSLQSLLVDGVIAGVGAVLAFLPQIAILFFFVAVLEDCGYMSRAAYLTDGLMSRIGLSGKSFIPLLSSFACAVPGIMAARVIEDRRDRLVTILVAPLMSCSARLPVYTLLIAAFIPNQSWLGGWLGLQGITMFGLYCIGIVASVVVALILKKTLLPGQTPPFVMELPDYRIPSFRTVLSRSAEQCWAFVRNAGTLILAVTVLVWAAGYYPRNAQVTARIQEQFALEIRQVDQEIDRFESGVAASDSAQDRQDLLELKQRRDSLEKMITHRIAAAQLEYSCLGRAGKCIEPVVRPLGWDWRIGCSVIASFPAREVVISAMGVIFHMGEVDGDEVVLIQQQLKNATWTGTDRPLFTTPVALSIMVFFALCAQCGATLITIRRETESNWWPLFTFGYMTVLAYVGALIVYQVGSRI